MFFNFNLKKQISFILLFTFVFTITSDIALHAKETGPKRAVVFNHDLFNSILDAEEKSFKEQNEQIPEDMRAKEEEVDFLLLKKDFEFNHQFATGYINQLDEASLNILGNIYAACLQKSLFVWQKKRKGDVEHYKRTIEEGLHTFYSRPEFVADMNVLLFNGFSIAKRFRQKPEVRFLKVQKLVDNTITKFKEIDPSLHDEAFKFLSAYGTFITHSSSATKFMGSFFHKYKKLIGTTVAVTAGIGLVAYVGWRLIPADKKARWFKSVGQNALSAYIDADGLTATGRAGVAGAIDELKKAMVVQGEEEGTFTLAPEAKVMLDDVETKVTNYINSEDGQRFIDGRLSAGIGKLLEDEEKAKRLIATAVTATGDITFNPEARGVMGDVTHEAVQYPDLIGNFMVRAIVTAMREGDKIKKENVRAAREQPDGEEQQEVVECRSPAVDIVREFLKPVNRGTALAITDRVVQSKTIMTFVGRKVRNFFLRVSREDIEDGAQPEEEPPEEE